MSWDMHDEEGKKCYGFSKKLCEKIVPLCEEGWKAWDLYPIEGVTTVKNSAARNSTFFLKKKE